MRSIEKRLTLYVILFSVSFGLIFSAVQISYDYLSQSERFEQATNAVLSRQSGPAALGLYNYDSGGLRTLLSSLMLNQGIVAASVVEADTQFQVRVGLSADDIATNKELMQSYIIELEAPPVFSSRSEVLGYLTIWVDEGLIHQGFEARASLTLVLDLLRNIVLAAVLILVFRQRLTGPIRRLAARIIDVDPQSPVTVPLAVEEPLQDSELDDLVGKMNHLLTAMDEEIHQRQQAETRVRQLNEQLEEKVRARTQALHDSNSQLRTSLDELQRTQDLLLQAQRMASLGHLAAGMAHEINNPVAVVYSNIATLSEYLTELVTLADNYQKAEGDIAKQSVRVALEEMRNAIDLDFVREDAPDLIRTSKNSLDRVRHIVSELKTFAANENGQKHTEVLATLVDTALADIHVENKDKVRVIHQNDGAPSIPCYPDQLRMAICKVLINAYEAMPGGGTLEVAYDSDAQFVSVVIHDSGVGMTNEDISCAVNPFFTRKEVGQGTGMGLTVAFNVMNNHGGELQIESTPGKGTSITLRLPRAG
ncbi:hypothetical protein CHH28_09935 [Bacterioplanes sanyensis]|uniref:histidine kinase n=1 Tax=Bacterioplanes sanyensis TaxID=1249553 RepID=A0A222FJ11_9GAMM|nr:hypothetical protein CHH28_09935 [Bacterioplanes sanyensis]